MSTAVAPIANTPANTPALQLTPVSSQPAKSNSQPTTAVDTVQLSSAAQAALTATQTFLENTDTHAQLLKAAAGGDPLARSVLAAEAAFVGIPKGT